MPPREDEKKTYRLTEWGSFVNRHSVLTRPAFWTQLEAEVRGMADRDEDFDVALDERIHGLQEFRARRAVHGDVKNWQPKTRGIIDAKAALDAARRNPTERPGIPDDTPCDHVLPDGKTCRVTSGFHSWHDGSDEHHFESKRYGYNVVPEGETSPRQGEGHAT